MSAPVSLPPTPESASEIVSRRCAASKMLPAFLSAPSTVDADVPGEFRVAGLHEFHAVVQDERNARVRADGRQRRSRDDFDRVIFSGFGLEADFAVEELPVRGRRRRKHGRGIFFRAVAAERDVARSRELERAAPEHGVQIRRDGIAQRHAERRAFRDDLVRGDPPVDGQRSLVDGNAPGVREAGGVDAQRAVARLAEIAAVLDFQFLGIQVRGFSRGDGENDFADRRRRRRHVRGDEVPARVFREADVASRDALRGNAARGVARRVLHAVGIDELPVAVAAGGKIDLHVVGADVGRRGRHVVGAGAGGAVAHAKAQVGDRGGR